MTCHWYVDLVDPDGRHLGNAVCGDDTRTDTLAEHRSHAAQRVIAGSCLHGVGVPCNTDAPLRRDFRVEDIDRLQSDYGYGGTRGLMGIAVAQVDRQVVNAANAHGMKECEFQEWLSSKLGRWYGEDDGYFHKRSAQHRPTAALQFEGARTSMTLMRQLIAEGTFY